ncbi:hypothetical protein [Actinacidiphila rubida]|uniref:Uncharacterized protein n=1 Tax=Actinacidiphila rubida TaxID=310780 RepID=A0A1H8TBW2_9ACTN|nr:hypothetical protein SAMN05216267_105018 [Actinacidiphila rubida]
MLWKQIGPILMKRVRRFRYPGRRLVPDREVLCGGSNIEILAPGAFLSSIVPLDVFFTFQQYFVEGVMVRSLKWSRCGARYLP